MSKCRICGYDPAPERRTSETCERCAMRLEIEAWRPLDHPAPTEPGNYYFKNRFGEVKVVEIWRSDLGEKALTCGHGMFALTVDRMVGRWSGRIPDALEVE